MATIQIKTWKVTRKIPFPHTVMNRLVNWYAVCMGIILSSPLRMKHVLALIKFFLKTMMIVTTNPYYLYKFIRY